MGAWHNTEESLKSFQARETKGVIWDDMDIYNNETGHRLSKMEGNPIDLLLDANFCWIERDENGDRVLRYGPYPYPGEIELLREDCRNLLLDKNLQPSK